MVEPDGNGHNEIIWAWTVDANAFPQVIVLKETNIYNQFVQLAVVPTTEGYFTDLSSDVNRNADRYAIIGVMANGAEAPRSNIHQSVHLSINRGITDNTYNLIWNAYQGTEIASYSIWRGSNESNLTMIASLSGANVSYTDVAPSATDTYYAVEYTLPESQNAPRRVMSSAANSHSGRSNVVNRDAAKTIVYAQSLSIMSANKQYSTTADQPLLLLYAEVKPANTTIKAVQWEITNGANLATIDPSSGLLTARTPNTGGVVTVKATAKDGSGISATKQITIAAIADTSIPEDFYYTIRFLNYDGTELQSSSVKDGETPVYNGATPTRADSEQYTYTFTGWSPTIVAVTEEATYTAQYDSTEKTVVVPKNYVPYNLNASVDGTAVTFTWSVQDLPTYFGIAIYYGNQEVFSGTTINNNTSLTLTISDYSNKFGTYIWKLCSVDENKQPISEWVNGPSFEIRDPKEGLEDVQATDVPMKVIINGQIFILRGDKVYTITGQEVE